MAGTWTSEQKMRKLRHARRVVIQTRTSSFLEGNFLNLKVPAWKPWRIVDLLSVKRRIPPLSSDLPLRQLASHQLRSSQTKHQARLELLSRVRKGCVGSVSFSIAGMLLSSRRSTSQVERRDRNHLSEIRFPTPPSLVKFHLDPANFPA